jgi:hypothetical protein
MCVTHFVLFPTKIVMARATQNFFDPPWLRVPWAIVPESLNGSSAVFQPGIDAPHTEANFPRTALRFRGNDTFLALLDNPPL